MAVSASQFACPFNSISGDGVSMNRSRESRNCKFSFYFVRKPPIKSVLDEGAYNELTMINSNGQTSKAHSLSLSLSL